MRKLIYTATAHTAAISQGLSLRKRLLAWGCWSALILCVPALQAADLEVRTFATSCYNGQDGILLLTLRSGPAPVFYQWSGPDNRSGIGEFSFVDQSKVFGQLPAGEYNVSITDASGQSSTFKGIIAQPAPIMVSTEAIGEPCLGLHTGVIRVTQTSGGTAPYDYFFQNNFSGSQNAWTNLKPGQYFITVRDAKGCFKTEGAVLPVGNAFEFRITPRIYELFSGDTLQLNYPSLRLLGDAEWTPAAFAVTVTPNEALLFPPRSERFTVRVTDLDGCQALDTIEVQVKRRRSVFAPNVFSPSSLDPANSFFTLYSDGGVQTILSLQVFDPWGRMVFEGNDMAPNMPTLGWDGTFRGQRLPPGVFVWKARLLFSDGREALDIGDVSMVY